jgi:type IV secretory pathway VirB2 component (pilin)
MHNSSEATTTDTCNITTGSATSTERPLAQEVPLLAAASSPNATPAAKKRNSERGEGVISTAVAVLIIAFLGIALWTGFNSMMSTATSRTRTQVEQIGR